MILGLIKKFLPSLSGMPVKLGLIVTLVTTLSAFYMWDRSNTFQAGYNEAALQYETQMSKRVVEEITKTKVTWQLEFDKAITVAQEEVKVKEVVKTVYRDVYRTDFECTDVGENALELLNRVFEEETPNAKTN